MLTALLFALASKASPLSIESWAQQGLAAAKQEAAEKASAQEPFPEEPQVDKRPHVHTSSVPS